jgi:hypothetical protein
MIGHTFAQKTLVKIPNRGQNPRSQKGWFSFLARSPNFTIEVQNRPIWKFFIISGNTFFVIGGHSNFECKLAKNLVERAMNSNRAVGKLQLRYDYPTNPVIKTYDTLCESCRSIAPLQLLFLENFEFVVTFRSSAISNQVTRNRYRCWRRRRRAKRARV